MAAAITPLDPNSLEIQSYSPQDLGLLFTEPSPSIFNPSIHYVEYTIQSLDRSYTLTDHNFTGYQVIANTIDGASGFSTTYEIDLDPEKNLLDAGFFQGSYNTIYNFFSNKLGSSFEGQNYYLKSISPDRTEVRLASNILTNFEIEDLINQFKRQSNELPYFQDFYLNFGDNELVIANNILLDKTSTQYEVLINLYEPLPPQFDLKDTLWIVTKAADSLAFNVEFEFLPVTPRLTNPTLKGPNLNLSLKDRINNSTNYINYEQLLTTGFVSSYDQILSYLAEKSIEIGINYSDFSSFIHFSSAVSRVENFFYKVQLIEQYNSSLNIINSTTNTSITSSTLYYSDKITNIIKNFDGFEYYLYFETGSTTYPKSTVTPPYTLVTSSDASVTTWYEGLLSTALNYDQNNQDYLINTIPSYLRDDPQNEPYKVFIDMIGQYYDNIWVYYKDVTNRYSGDNRIEYGISKDLVADAIRSFGLKIYQNNFSTSDLFNAFTGFDSGSYLRTKTVNTPSNTLPPGSDREKIATYITASRESYYTPLDDVNKEMYKRIYHNLPYLLKSKGTVAGLQNIISMYGLPVTTTLNVNELGGNYTNTIPRTGIRDIVNDRILILSSSAMDASLPDINAQYTQEANTLSPFRGIEQVPPSTASVSPDISSLEVAFSPQTQTDNRIKSALGYFDIGEYIGDPRQTFYPTYPDLWTYADNYFSPSNQWVAQQPYFKPINYIRLIKYFDNSLFKMIKDFVPARTNLKSGIVIKQHLLERSKIVQPQVTSSNNYYSGSITSGFITGSTGGTFNDYNSLTPRVNNTQSWNERVVTPLGITQLAHSDQAEFYNGELPYTPTSSNSIVASNGELDENNIFKYPNTAQFLYTVRQYSTSTNFHALNTETQFLTTATPAAGQILLWWESIINKGRGFKYAKVSINTSNASSINVADYLQQATGFSINYGVGGIVGSDAAILDFSNASITSYEDQGYYLFTFPTPRQSSWSTISSFASRTVVFSPDYVGFEYNDYNATLNNSEDIRTSELYVSPSYNTGILTPTNFADIMTGSGTPAPVEDSNYASTTWSRIRYDGSQYNSFTLPGTNMDYNYNDGVSPPNILDLAEGTFNSLSTDASGYNTLPAAEQNQTYFVYFQAVNSLKPTIIGESAFLVKYLVDSQGNSYIPKTGDTKDQIVLDNLVNNFEIGKLASVKLITPDPLGLVNSNDAALAGTYNITGVGRLEKILVTETGSSQGAYLPTMSFASIDNTQLYNTTPDYSFLAGATTTSYTTSSYAPVHRFQFDIPDVTLNPLGDYDNATSTYTFATSTGDYNNRVSFSLKTDVRLSIRKANAPAGYPGNLYVSVDIRRNGQPIGLGSSQSQIYNFPISSTNGFLSIVKTFNLTTNLLEYNAGDEITATFTISNIPAGYTLNSPTDKLVIVAERTSFSSIPEYSNGPRVVPSPYWTIGEYVTGSNRSSILTASAGLYDCYSPAFKQDLQSVVDIAGLTFDTAFNSTNEFSLYSYPVNTPFQVQPGDKIRFEYNPNNLHTITNVNESSTLYLTITPPVPTGSMLDHFILYRLVNNGMYINLKVDTALESNVYTGIIQPKFVSKELTDSYDSTIAKLSQQDLIS
jgi:hypothetical protein